MNTGSYLVVVVADNYWTGNSECMHLVFLSDNVVLPIFFCISIIASSKSLVFQLDIATFLVI